MDFKQWMAACPERFPEYLEDTTSNHNPVIGGSLTDTLQNACDVVSVVQELLLSPQEGGTAINEEAILGMVCILNSVLSALQFEIAHRI